MLGCPVRRDWALNVEMVKWTSSLAVLKRPRGLSSQTYSSKEIRVPGIPREWLLSTFFVYSSEADALAGATEGGSGSL